MKSETRLEILQDLKKEQEQYIRDIDYTLEDINYDPDDEDNTNYRRYCELEVIQTGHRQIVKALDETIYFLQNIEELEEKIKYLEKANEWVEVENRLPNEFKEYYVTLDNFTEELVEYTQADEDCGEWTIGRFEKINGKPSYEIYEVIAWREKPEPYKKE